MAGRIPQQFIDDLMQRVDIVDVIDARVQLRKQGREYVACCPFHDEKTPSFTVSPEKQFYHCFGCGAHGTALGFLMEYEHMGFTEAVEELAGRLGMTVPHGEGGKPGEPDTDLYTLLGEADRFYRRALRRDAGAPGAVEYLKGRGVSGEIAAEFGLGYAPDAWDALSTALATDATRERALLSLGLTKRRDTGGCYDRFRNRVMFPIHDYRGRVVGFGGRALGDETPKYLNSPESPVFHKGRELYGLHQARDAIRREQTVLIVEGYMDVVALAQFGLCHCVATLGTATTRPHLERVFRHAPEVVFCFDGDRAGRQAAWRAMETVLPLLSEGRQAGFLFLPEGEDPDSLVRKEGAEGLRARIAKAQPLPDFMFGSLAKGVDMERLDGRARLAELSRPLLARLPAGVLKEMMFDRLAQLTGTDRQTLTRLMAGSGADARTGPRRRPPPAADSAPAWEDLVRNIVALLLRHPQVAAQVDCPDALRTTDLPGFDTICEVMDLAKSRSGLTAGGIVEHFREAPYYPRLEKLVGGEHIEDEDAALQRLRDGLIGLSARAVSRQLDLLFAKERSGRLSPEEKRRLSALILQKQELESQRVAR